MTRKTRNFLVHGAAGIVALALVAFGVKQCNDKENARAKEVAVLEKARHAQEIAEVAINTLKDKKDCAEWLNKDRLAARHEADSLKNEIVMRDTIIGEMVKDLEECKNAKKAKVVRKRIQRAPVAKKHVKTGGAVTVVNETKKVACRADTTTTAKTCVKFDEGTCNNTVNINNGTINNYYAPVDTVKKIQESRFVRVYGNRRVLCH